MEKLRNTESKEKSFLKGVVGKRLEELASSQARLDPLELLGLSSPPASSIQSEQKLPISSSSPPDSPSQDLSMTSSLSLQSHSDSTSRHEKASTIPITSLQPEVMKRDTLSEYSDSPRRRSDRSIIRPVYSESRTDRVSVSNTDSLPHTPPAPHIKVPPTELPQQNFPPLDIPISLLRPPSHWVRFAWALHSCRDQSTPTHTRAVSYAEIGGLVDRTEDAVRRSLLQLMSAGLIVRTALHQHANGGSIYLFGPAFPALLTPLTPGKKKGPRPRVPYGSHSQNDSRTHSQNIGSSSSSSLSHSELLQEWGVQNLILSEWFSALDPRTVEPFLRVMPSLEYAQDFFDKVTAVIEHKKSTTKPIADALGFLFGCLKKMEVNPPPGWKSRRVRLLEEEAQRLEREATAIKAARDRVDAQRCELYMLGLPPEIESELRAKAAEAAADNELPVVRETKRERKLQELIREHMRHNERTKMV